MDRNNSRYTYIRRQGNGQGQGQQHQQQNQQNQQQNQQQQSSSLSSSSSSSLSSTSNNQHMDNHRNSSLSSQSSASMMPSYSSTMSREPLTQHDELIRYIREAWTKVSEQGTPVVYRNESDHQLKNFKPFDLEEYWGQRLVQNIHVSHGHQ